MEPAEGMTEIQGLPVWPFPQQTVRVKPDLKEVRPRPESKGLKTLEQARVRATWETGEE